EQNRALPYAPPTRLRFVDDERRLHLRPFVYRLVEREGAGGVYDEDRSRPYPVRFLVRASEALGASTGPLRLFGVEEPARIFLLGTDGFGRDQLSRLLHGAQISLFAGLMAATLSLGVGWLLGPLAARGFGASDLYLIRRHIAPQTFGLLLTQAALLVPQYILAEVTLSFLGLGVGEPVPSWGNMLAALQRYHVLASCWWMWVPGLALVPVFLAYFALSEALHVRAEFTGGHR